MNVLVVAAHPDDEVLGVGGTIARYRRAGHAVFVQFLTNGVGSRGNDDAAVQRRCDAMRAAAKILDFSVLEPAAFADNQMDAVPLLEIVKVIERAKQTAEPDLVLTHFWNDLNIDHRRAFEATITAFRPQPGETCHAIYCFEVASATGWGSPSAIFHPSDYVELSSGDVETAVRAYEAYVEEVRPDPHTRSINAFRARRLLRGRDAGLEWAEGLMLYRNIQRL